MRKHYTAPCLFVDTFVPDTMIASTLYKGLYNGRAGGPKNDNAGNNQNCWGYNCNFGEVEDGRNACLGDTISYGC